MRKLTVVLGLAAALFTFAAMQSPASAHTDKVFQGNDFAIVYSDHMSGSVCDEERDGHDVFARWSSSQGDGTWTADANGSSGSCETVEFRGGDGRLLTAEVFQVCEVGRRTVCETEYT
jgi:hypothetical protein